MLPWPDMWRRAIGAGLHPSAFWQLTLREWQWLFAPADAALQLPALQSLMEQYPDG